mgnify:CR=1 FL=1
MVNTGKIIKYNVFAEWQVDDTCYKVIFVFAETYIFIQVSRSDQIEIRPDRIGFTEPFFRRIAGKMGFFRFRRRLC